MERVYRYLLPSTKKAALFVTIALCLAVSACTDNFVDVENKEADEKRQEEASTPDDPGTPGSAPWRLIASPATPRTGAMTTVIGQWLYIYGGEDYSGVRRDFFRYNLETGESELLPLGDYRAHGTMTAVGGRLYVFGGYDNTGADITKNNGQLRYFDTVTNTWTSLGTADTNGTFPDERHGHVAAYYRIPEEGRDKLYFQGGFTGTGNASNGVIVLDLDDPPKPTWSTRAAGPTRGHSGAAIISGRLYVFGGYTKSNTGDTYSNELYEYRITANTWSLVGSLSGATGRRAGTAVVAIGANLYLYGGTAPGNHYGDLWRFNTSLPPFAATSPWRQLTAGPSGRCNMGVAVFDDRMHVFGGHSENDLGQGLYTAELWEYDPEREPVD